MFHPVICRHSGYYMDYCCLISVNINIIDQETTLISDYQLTIFLLCSSSPSGRPAFITAVLLPDSTAV